MWDGREDTPVIVSNILRVLQYHRTSLSLSACLSVSLSLSLSLCWCGCTRATLPFGVVCVARLNLMTRPPVGCRSRGPPYLRKTIVCSSHLISSSN